MCRKVWGQIALTRQGNQGPTECIVALGRFKVRGIVAPPEAVSQAQAVSSSDSMGHLFGWPIRAILWNVHMQAPEGGKEGCTKRTTRGSLAAQANAGLVALADKSNKRDLPQNKAHKPANVVEERAPVAEVGGERS